MLTTLERLALLENRAQRAAEALESLEACQSLAASQLQADYLTALQVAEETLAAAETLLLLEQERLAVLARVQAAFPGGTKESAETPALTPLLLTKNAERS